VRFHAPRRQAQAAGAVGSRMDHVHLGLASTLHIHASGALTFCAVGEPLPDWDGDIPLLALEA